MGRTRSWTTPIPARRPTQPACGFPAPDLAWPATGPHRWPSSASSPSSSTAAARPVAGGHDDRIYFATWGEMFWGSAEEFDYVQHANVTHAAELRGRMLLIHGELDDNVTPHVTMRLVDAFMAADRDVDLMIVPNADHL